MPKLSIKTFPPLFSIFIYFYVIHVHVMVFITQFQEKLYVHDITKFRHYYNVKIKQQHQFFGPKKKSKKKQRMSSGLGYKET